MNSLVHGTQEWFDSLNLRKPTQKPTKKVLITLHGGCFVGGSANWDQPQIEFLRQLNPDQLHVYQLEFKKDNLKTTLQDIARQVRELKTYYSPESHFYVLGRSSGGYLAKVLFDFCHSEQTKEKRFQHKERWVSSQNRLFEKAIYLAPVFNPITRGNKIPTLGEKARPFFDNQKSIYSTIEYDSNLERLFIPTHDENVPKECYTEYQKKEAFSMNIKTHSAMCKTTSKEFATHLKEFLEI